MNRRGRERKGRSVNDGEPMVASSTYMRDDAVSFHQIQG